MASVRSPLSTPSDVARPRRRWHRCISLFLVPTLGHPAPGSETWTGWAINQLEGGQGGCAGTKEKEPKPRGSYRSNLKHGTKRREKECGIPWKTGVLIIAWVLAILLPRNEWRKNCPLKLHKTPPHLEPRDPHVTTPPAAIGRDPHGPWCDPLSLVQ